MKAALLSALAICTATGSAAGAAKPPESLQSAEFSCDALTVPGRLDAATVRALGPAHSLDAAAAVLAQHKVKFGRRRGVMTLTEVPERLIQQIYQLPQGEPIVLPNGDGSAICVLVPSEDSI